jgi:hypothetical protein
VEDGPQGVVGLPPLAPAHLFHQVVKPLIGLLHRRVEHLQSGLTHDRILSEKHWHTGRRARRRKHRTEPATDQ